MESSDSEHVIRKKFKQIDLKAPVRLNIFTYTISNRPST